MNKYQEIQNLADKRGLFFPTAEIHKSLSGFWDFGYMATNLRRKIVELWRRELIRKTDSIEIEGSNIMPKQTFKASGHLKFFVDPLVQCKKCRRMFRADKLIEKHVKESVSETFSVKKFNSLIKTYKIKCPSCKGSLGNVKKFNMMIGTSIGPIEKEYNAYLRPETCQTMFTDFMKIYKTSRRGLPLGIAQLGRAYRNEISPRQMMIRLREITQLELEVFFNPYKINEVPNLKKYKNYKLRLQRIGKETESVTVDDAIKTKMFSGKLIVYYLVVLQQFFEKCGFEKKNIRFRQLKKEETAFYSKETWDFEILTSTGWVEVVANNYRGDYDLTSHSKFSGQDFNLIEDEKKFIPHVFEISMGLDRLMYCIMENSLSKRDKKPLLKLPRYIVPLDFVVLPLVKKDGIDKKAKEIYEMLKMSFDTTYDEKGSIGKRYVLYDQLGVPLAITVDYESLKKNDCTLRDRDTTKQKRFKIEDLPKVIKSFLNGEEIFK